MSFHGSSTMSVNTATSVSTTHDFGTGSNRFALLNVARDANAVSSATVGGNSCTQHLTPHTTGEGSYPIESWYRIAPPTGSQTVTVNFSVAAATVVGILSFNDIDQTTPFRTLAAANSDGLDQTPTGTASASANGDDVVLFTGSNTAFAPVVPNGSAIEVYDVEPIFISNWCARITATGANTTISGASTGFEGWNGRIVSLIQAAGGAAASPPPPKVISQAVHRAASY